MEHLRHVAGARGADPAAVAAETAAALASMCHDPGALVVTARRMVEHHPDAAQLWWACATIVTSIDPCSQCQVVARQLREDSTSVSLGQAIGGLDVVCTIGWSAHLLAAVSEIAATGPGADPEAAPEVLVVEASGDGRDMVEVLNRAGLRAELVAADGAGEAARAADAVVVPALAVGPADVLAPGGALGLAAVASVSQVPVWALTSRGTRLPGPLWDEVVSRFRAASEPWANGTDLVPHALFSHAAGADGAAPLSWRPELLSAECSHAPELLRRSAL